MSSGLPDHTVLRMPALSPTMTQVLLLLLLPPPPPFCQQFQTDSRTNLDSGQHRFLVEEDWRQD
jgi:hypothetical protein